MSDMYTDTEPANELLEMIYPELFVKIWKAVYHKDIYESKERHQDYVVLNLLKQATINFTHVNERLCASMGSEKYGIISLLVEEFKHPLMSMNSLKKGVSKALWDSPRETLKKMVNILANIVRMNIDSKPVYRQANAVEHLEELLSCHFLLMRAKALFTLVYLINEDENEALNQGDDNIKFVLKVLGKCLDEKGHYSKHYTFSAAVVMDGIVYLAANDSNKVKLVKHGLLPKLIPMMTSNSLAEKRSASRVIWKLAFHEDNKTTLKENEKLITVLKELAHNEPDQHILKACKTVLWMLDVEDGSNSCRPKTAKKQRPKTANKDGTETQTAGDVTEAKDPDQDVVSLDDNDLDDDGTNMDDNPPHVMISYQWGVQTQMIKIKELLKAAGFNVWMDIDDMGGSTLESMAAAVEHSAVVLVCFTEKYKLSASCRTEAEYTYKLQKPIIPLRLQEEYDPDGWLGIMIGTKLYVDFSTSHALEENLKKLKQLLGDRGRVGEENKSTLKTGTNKDKLNSTITRTSSTRRNTVPKVTDFMDAKTVSSWSSDQVSSWLVTNDLGELKNRFEGFNGQRLLGLKTISTDAPDFFFTEIKKDLGFKSLLDIVKFKQALDEII
ncbi:uncharacterized protein [Asterias amurensis]|uniref:uncharacterized protein isoform X2 n=1 Tax=Asterias amurensis TaxID=7602 RepID=UPI003AB912D4